MRERVEDRCLLSVAALDIQNQSSYTVTFDFRWTPSSSWTAYTEGPGQSEIFSTAYSTSLTPQVIYDKTTSANSQTTATLTQGYGDWSGTGSPPASAATLYAFQNTTTGVVLSYVSPGPAASSTDAVLEIQNKSSYTITFDFRWSPNSAWTAYTESPGQGELLWTNYSSSLTPQVLYDTTPSPFSQTTVTLVQGYGQWTGTGNPPASAATQYEFLNTRSGVELYYSGASDPDSNPYSYSDANANSYANANPHADANSHANPNPDSHPITQSERDYQLELVGIMRP